MRGGLLLFLLLLCVCARGVRAAVADPLADLHSADPYVRRSAIDRIAAERLSAGIKPLRKFLKDGDVLVREASAWALGELGDAASVPTLSKALKTEKSLLVRAAILQALLKIRTPGAKGSFSQALLDRSPVLRRPAALGLGLLGGGEIVETLVEQARDPSPHVREAVALALGLARDEAAKAALDFLKADSIPLVRDKAAFALKLQDKSGGIEAALSGLGSKDLHTRVVSAAALGLWGGGDEVKGVLQRVSKDDPDSWVRREAGRSLEKIASLEALERRKARVAAQKAKAQAQKKAKGGGQKPVSPAQKTGEGPTPKKAGSPTKNP